MDHEECAFQIILKKRAIHFSTSGLILKCFEVQVNYGCCGRLFMATDNGHFNFLFKVIYRFEMFGVVLLLKGSTQKINVQKIVFKWHSWVDHLTSVENGQFSCSCVRSRFGSIFSVFSKLFKLKLIHFIYHKPFIEYLTHRALAEKANGPSLALY